MALIYRGMTNLVTASTHREAKPRQKLKLIKIDSVTRLQPWEMAHKYRSFNRSFLRR